MPIVRFGPMVLTDGVLSSWGADRRRLRDGADVLELDPEEIARPLTNAPPGDVPDPPTFDDLKRITSLAPRRLWIYVSEALPAGHLLRVDPEGWPQAMGRPFFAMPPFVRSNDAVFFMSMDLADVLSESGSARRWVEQPQGSFWWDPLTGEAHWQTEP